MGLIGSLGCGSQFCFFSRLVVMMWLLGCDFGGYFNRFYSGGLRVVVAGYVAGVAMDFHGCVLF